MVSHSLSNPLIENEPAPSTAVQYSRPRFDYYTDPMSAFSADKRRNNFLHQVSQGYSSVPPNMTLTPGQRPTHAPGGHHIQSSSLGAPMGAAGPLGPQGNTSNTWGGSYSSLNYNYPPNMRDVNFPKSGVGQGDSGVRTINRQLEATPTDRMGPLRVESQICSVFFPLQKRDEEPIPSDYLIDLLNSHLPDNYRTQTQDSPHAVQGWGRGGRYRPRPRPQPHSHQDSPNMLDVNFPNSGVGRGDSPHAVHGWGRGGRYSNSHGPQLHSHHDSPNMLDVNFPNSGLGPGDSPHAVHGWGRGRYSNSPRPQLHSRHDSRHSSGRYSDWGRGRGPSLSLGPSSRRGKDSQNPVSAELRPDLYYNKEMLEDPWKGMTPVIWKAPNSDGSWLPKLLA